MPERAHVSSVEALESFRASLIVYLSKARPALEEVSSEVLRTRVWLQNDQRTHWENQVRRRAKELEQARLSLSSVRMSSLAQSTDLEQMAVRRATRSLEEAEIKLKRVKQWSREFDSRIEPMAKQLDGLMNIFTNDMPRAVAYLAQTLKTLAEYAEMTPAPAGPPASHDPSSAVPEPGSPPQETVQASPLPGQNS